LSQMLIPGCAGRYALIMKECGIIKMAVIHWIMSCSKMKTGSNIYFIASRKVPGCARTDKVVF